MSLPIHKILWAGNDPSHYDHLHVEGEPTTAGWTTGEGTQPPTYNPGMTEAIQDVFHAMDYEYGEGYYFEDTPPPEPNWAHMGYYNRRPIAGSTRWSQHAYANALDIGPLYGTDLQAPIYEYLTNYDGDNMPSLEEIVDALRPVIREELDRRIDGKAGPVNGFYGIGSALAITPIGATNPDTGKAPPQVVGGYLQKTYIKVKNLD